MHRARWSWVVVREEVRLGTIQYRAVQYSTVRYGTARPLGRGARFSRPARDMSFPSLAHLASPRLQNNNGRVRLWLVKASRSPSLVCGR